MQEKLIGRYIKELENRLFAIQKDKEKIKVEVKEEFQSKYLEELEGETLHIRSEMYELRHFDMPLALAKGLIEHFSQSKTYFNKQHSEIIRELLGKYSLELVLDLARERIEK